MNHKRGKPKSCRAGCLMCKPHKAGWINDEKLLGNNGFGKLRSIDAAKKQEKEVE